MCKFETQRLCLRPAGKADLDDLHQVFSDPRAMAYWSNLPHTDPEETAQFLHWMMVTPPGEGVEFVVEHDNRVIGKAGFWRFPEIGFIFHPDYWGRGLATKAVAAVIEYGFQTCNLSKITADVDPRNIRSIRLLEKLGFAETHREANTIKVGDDWCDSVYFKLDSPVV